MFRFERARRRRFLVFSPSRQQRVGDRKKVQDSCDGAQYNVLDGLRPIIKGGHRRQDHGPHFRKLDQAAKVSEMERGLTNYEHEPASFLEGHVGGSQQKVVRVRVGDVGKGFHRTGRDHHAVGRERPAGDGGEKIGGIVDFVRQGLDVPQAEVGFGPKDLCGGLGYEERGADVGDRTEGFQKAHAVDHAGSSGDADNQAFHDDCLGLWRGGSPEMGDDPT